jgi:WS/DGAT/MGAT family acyltransferase
LSLEQLSGLDSAFLFLDGRRAPMHIGSVQLYAPPEDGFDFGHIVDVLAGRLDEAPLLKRRVVQVPLRLGRPFWTEDPHFSIDRHVAHTALPTPGDWSMLMGLAEDLFAQPLDPDRPLWDMTVVEGVHGIPGVPEGGFAVISKVHHAAADGMGSVDLYKVLWDDRPVPRRGRRRRRMEPGRLPSTGTLLGQATRGVLTQPAAVARWAGELLRGGVGYGREWIAGRHHRPPTPFTAPRTILNQPVSGRRSFDAVTLSLKAIADLRSLNPGVTVNDVVLAVCAGGMRRYLDERRVLPDESLVAMVPISVRGAMAEGANHVSAMLIPLETGLDDPVTRLHAIHGHATDSKAYAEALGASTLADSQRFLPFSLATAAARLYTGFHLSRLHRPPFNLVITNVPGPRQPLYLAGARLLNIFGHAPVFDGLGLILVITSYLDRLTISATADHDTVPDPDRLVAHLAEAFEELRELAVREAEGLETKPRRRRSPAGGRRAKVRTRKTAKGARKP